MPKKHERNHPQKEYRPARLLQESTTDHDDPVSLSLDLQQPYSCCRATPAHTPNDNFISLRKKIQRIQSLQGDEYHGVRAYGAAMASIAAYPQKLTSPNELRRLPHCGETFVALLEEFLDTGRLQEAENLETDKHLWVMNEFYEIGGCGYTTAKNFWNLGYRSLDDILENHWSSLTRDQQVGRKYYDEFLLRISRAEVESIGQTVLDAANELYPDGGYHMLVVGSYRRGSETSGDADLILSR